MSDLLTFLTVGFVSVVVMVMVLGTMVLLAAGLAGIVGRGH